MKLSPAIQSRSRRGRSTGFTLVETMISAWIFLIIFIGVMVALQIFGLRVYTLGATKLSATAGALKVLNNIRDDIRESKTLSVGSVTNGNPSTFTNPPTGLNIGNALQIYSTTNNLPYTVYFLDTSTATNSLKMAITTDGTTFTTTTLASYITNLVVFDAEDCNGNILTDTNNANNRIIRMELDFYQWEYPIGYVGGVGFNAYDFYRLTTKVSRRDID